MHSFNKTGIRNMSKINAKAIHDQVTTWINSERDGVATQQMINKLVAYKSADLLIGTWASEIADQTPEDNTERNRLLSIFRGQLRRGATSHEFTTFPTVKVKDNSYAVQWKDFPVKEELDKELNEAFKAFKKTPGKDEASALANEMAAYAKAIAAKASAEAHPEIVPEQDAALAELDIDEIDDDAAELVEAIEAMQA